MDNQLPGSQTSTPILVFPTPLLSGAADISHPILHMVVERVPHKLPFVTVFRVSCVYTFVCVCVCLSVCLSVCVCLSVSGFLIRIFVQCQTGSKVTWPLCHSQQ